MRLLMKIFFSRQRHRMLGVAFLLLISVLMLGLRAWRQHFYCPTSDKFISPYNGKENPEFAAFLTPLINQSGDTVYIELGNCPADVIKVAVFQYLSPIIRMHPRAAVFEMTWDFNVFHYYAGVRLIYNRTEGEIEVVETGTTDSSQTRTILGKNLTDRDIHQAACSDMDYDVWAQKHWK